MSLSVASRRRLQTTNAPSSVVNPSSSSSGGRYQLPLSVRKQHSFIEPTARYSTQQRGYLSRGLSVGRSIENIRQKLYPVGRQASLAVEETTPRTAPRITASQVQGLRLRDRSGLVAWSSTSSLLKDQETERAAPQVEPAEIKISAKADKNRINLNIVLSQTIRATNEREQEQEPEPEPEVDVDAEAGRVSDNEDSHPVENPDIQLSISPALTVQRRPPLVRAMSAPVRGLDESSKGVIAASKRSQQKLRRRKIFTRTPSSTVNLDVIGDSSTSSSVAGNATKKALNRARSVVAPDVITLVSLLSSEGSDSEREDNSSVAVSSPPAGGLEKQNSGATQRRAPLLRKTGKSVSFQDSYPPTFQLASKEYSHMIRRGSIAPLAARIRANRPPTAPPVSIFLTDVQAKMDQQPKKEAGAELPPVATLSSPDEAKKENNNNAANCEDQQPQPDHNYPAYVRSLKERECWKLHQKMGAKGVSVSYETVLRGMLTPTEFRHFQKQREQEEARVLEEAEAAEAAAAAAILESGEKEGRKPPVTAIERLSEALLQSK
ncbi:uncharacterized protein LOC120446777 isoform X1 [Drosophila santomea]|uniref:uncharacterized protein LOC120446777 isoform X1 n=1 Tax=Drosophila santomea TaxID=129105 RepID=UPI001953A246|nr:uncharacterized protein LOC120446777 isoform X1 [Drosophila santomea]